ncbi:putative xyloglucan glycosyltransferase 6 [Forsythia ovata]|uniref:Xyloglucan glycosyltransferase 6 n=1 Tax=Forsythia ovata TaxID=205694 RepID=A0ABD1T6A3_9LAMI
MSPSPNYEFQEWWNKQRASDHNELLSSSETSSFLTVDVRSHSTAAAVAEKDRSRSARQLSWIYLLKVHQIAHFLAFITSGFITLIRTAKRRVATASSSSPSGSPRSESKFYKIIKFFLLISVLLLIFELIAYFKGWHFSPPTLESEVEDLVEYIYAKWLVIRANYLAPPLQSLTNACIVLFMIQSVDRLVLVLGCFYIKFRGLRPVAEMEYENGVANVEDYPMVMVQIPMCNEREVYQQSIAAVCIQDWPRRENACSNTG